VVDHSHLDPQGVVTTLAPSDEARWRATLRRQPHEQLWLKSTVEARRDAPIGSSPPHPFQCVGQEWLLDEPGRGGPVLTLNSKLNPNLYPSRWCALAETDRWPSTANRHTAWDCASTTRFAPLSLPGVARIRVGALFHRPKNVPNRPNLAGGSEN